MRISRLHRVEGACGACSVEPGLAQPFMVWGVGFIPFGHFRRRSLAACCLAILFLGRQGIRYNGDLRHAEEAPPTSSDLVGVGGVQGPRLNTAPLPFCKLSQQVNDALTNRLMTPSRTPRAHAGLACAHTRAYGHCGTEFPRPVL